MMGACSAVVICSCAYDRERSPCHTRCDASVMQILLGRCDVCLPEPPDRLRVARGAVLNFEVRLRTPTVIALLPCCWQQALDTKLPGCCLESSCLASFSDTPTLYSGPVKVLLICPTMAASVPSSPSPRLPMCTGPETRPSQAMPSKCMQPLAVTPHHTVYHTVQSSAALRFTPPPAPPSTPRACPSGS